MVIIAYMNLFGTGTISCGPAVENLKLQHPAGYESYFDHLDQSVDTTPYSEEGNFTTVGPNTEEDDGKRQANIVFMSNFRRQAKSITKWLINRVLSVIALGIAITVGDTDRFRELQTAIGKSSLMDYLKTGKSSAFGYSFSSRDTAAKYVHKLVHLAYKDRDPLDPEFYKWLEDSA